MLKRWATWPRGIRGLAGIAAVVLALAIAWALFVPLADWLAHHDIGSATGSLHETALDNARGRLLALGAGLFAAGALIFTARNFALSREGHVTDRYTKAIEQLGSDKLAVRIGGIYALERVARDSAKDHPTVMEVLAAFIREPPPPDLADSPVRPSASGELARLRPDVQAAVTVIGRRISRNDRDRINLHGADLAHVNLPGANLTGTDLRSAHIHGANRPPAGWALDGDECLYWPESPIPGTD
jgi:Pentapeptide repeats (8 copies)